MGISAPPPGFRIPPPSAAPPPPVAQYDERPSRGGCLTILLGGNIISAVFLGWLWLAAPAAFRFLDRESPTFTFTVILGLLQGFFALALWRWQKWGFYGILVTTIFVSLVNLQEGGQHSVLGGLVGPALIWWRLQEHWDKMPYRTGASRTRAALFWIPAATIVGGFLLFGALRARTFTSISFDPTRNALLDVQTALEKGNAEGKRVIVLAGGDWCPSCKALDEMLRKEDEVKKLVKDRFIVVKVFVDASLPHDGLLAKYPQMTEAPTLFVLRKGGDCAAAAPASGLAADRTRLLEFLKRWLL